MDLWEAEALEAVMPGRTRPLALQCVSSIPASESAAEDEQPIQAQPESRTLIVKSLGHPEITTTSLFCELFGNLLARELGLETPKPALVSLSQELIEQLNPTLAPYNIRLAPGLGVGCQYLTGGLIAPVPMAALTNEELAQAAKLYAFDLLTQNPDRRTERPNCAFFAGRLIAYDFEMAFSFIYALGKQVAGWRVSRHGLAQNHIFREPLRIQSRDVEWTTFLGSVQGLTPGRLKMLIAETPPEWQGFALQVQKHLLNVKKNLRDFEVELARSLL